MTTRSVKIKLQYPHNTMSFDKAKREDSVPDMCYVEVPMGRTHYMKDGTHLVIKDNFMTQVNPEKNTFKKLYKVPPQRNCQQFVVKDQVTLPKFPYSCKIGKDTFTFDKSCHYSLYYEGYRITICKYQGELVISSGDQASFGRADKWGAPLMDILEEYSGKESVMDYFFSKDKKTSCHAINVVVGNQKCIRVSQRKVNKPYVVIESSYKLMVEDADDNGTMILNGVIDDESKYLGVLPGLFTRPQTFDYHKASTFNKPGENPKRLSYPVVMCTESMDSQVVFPSLECSQFIKCTLEKECIIEEFFLLSMMETEREEEMEYPPFYKQDQFLEDFPGAACVVQGDVKKDVDRKLRREWDDADLDKMCQNLKDHTRIKSRKATLFC